MSDKLIDINYHKRLNNGTNKIEYEFTEQEKDINGNVTRAKRTESKKIPREDNYIKLYITDITKLFNLPEGLGKLAVILSGNMTYEGFLFVNATLKKKIAEELGYKNYRSVDNNLAKLVKSKVLIKNDTGTYEFNPFIMAKGKWKDIYTRRKEWAVKIQITYSGNERIVETQEGKLEIKQKGEEKRTKNIIWKMKQKLAHSAAVIFHYTALIQAQLGTRAYASHVFQKMKMVTNGS